MPLRQIMGMMYLRNGMNRKLTYEQVKLAVEGCKNLTKNTKFLVEILSAFLNLN